MNRLVLARVVVSFGLNSVLYERPRTWIIRFVISLDGSDVQRRKSLSQLNGPLHTSSSAASMAGTSEVVSFIVLRDLWSGWARVLCSLSVCCEVLKTCGNVKRNALRCRGVHSQFPSVVITLGGLITKIRFHCS